MPRAFTQHSVCRLQSHYGCSCSSFAFIVLTHSIVLISQPIYSAVGRHLYPFQTLTVMNLTAVYIRCCPHLSFLLVHTGLHFYWACSQLYNRSARVELHMVFQSGSITLSAHQQFISVSDVPHLHQYSHLSNFSSFKQILTGVNDLFRCEFVYFLSIVRLNFPYVYHLDLSDIERSVTVSNLWICLFLFQFYQFLLHVF